MISEQEAQDSLREAHEVLAQFIDKRADHEKHLAELGKERAALSYEAHRGDPKARKRLDALHLEHSKADSEFLSLDAAVSEAQSRVVAAEAAAAKAAKAAKAQEILDLLPQLRSYGSLLDKATAEVLAQHKNLQGVIRQIRTLSERQYDDAGLPRDSSPVPSENLLRSACRRAVEASLVNTDLETMHLAPSDRHTGYELASCWADRSASWARRFIGDE
jgi:hypothetical protein